MYVSLYMSLLTGRSDSSGENEINPRTSTGDACELVGGVRSFFSVCMHQARGPLSNTSSYSTPVLSAAASAGRHV